MPELKYKSQIIYPSDIVDLFTNIKEYIDELGIQMLNKNYNHNKELSEFDDLIYKYLPKHKTDSYQEVYKKGHVDEEE